MLLHADDCQLVLIDYQARLMPAIHDAPAVLANARRLAQMAKLFDVPVWATEQNPTKLGATAESLAPLCDSIVAKMAFSGADELQPLLAPPVAAPRGNARSLPKHLQKPAEPERGSIVIAGDIEPTQARWQHHRCEMISRKRGRHGQGRQCVTQ